MEFLDISSIEGSQNSIYNSVEDHGREILILSIDIGQGKTDEIVIREHDTPKFLAKEFCRRHKLNPEAEKVIIDLIKQNIHVKPTIEVSMMADQKSRNQSLLIETQKIQSEEKPVPSNLHDSGTKNSKSMSKPNCGERLYQTGLIYKEKHEKKIEEIREKLNKEKMKETTFKPSITQDRKMPRLQLLQAEIPSNRVDRCHLLFEKSKKPSFSPSKQSSSTSTSQKLLNSRKKLQHYLELREQREIKPIRSKSPSIVSRDRSRKSCRSQDSEQKIKLSNEQTDKILNRIKTIRFYQIFEILNPNEDQKIDKNTVLKAKLSKNLEKILTPFLNELKKLSHGLSIDQFCKVMELYSKELTPEERTALLQIGKRRSSPCLNKNFMLSRDLVNDLWSPKYEEKLLVFENFQNL